MTHFKNKKDSRSEYDNESTTINGTLEAKDPKETSKTVKDQTTSAIETETGKTTSITSGTDKTTFPSDKKEEFKNDKYGEDEDKEEVHRHKVYSANVPEKKWDENDDDYSRQNQYGRDLSQSRQNDQKEYQQDYQYRQGERGQFRGSKNESGEFGNQGYPHQRSELYEQGQDWNGPQSRRQYSHYEDPALGQPDYRSRFEKRAPQDYTQINQYSPRNEERAYESRSNWRNENRGRNDERDRYNNERGYRGSYSNDYRGESYDRDRYERGYGDVNRDWRNENRGYGSDLSYNDRGYRNQDVEYRGYNETRPQDFSRESRDFGRDFSNRNLGRGYDSSNSYGYEQPSFGRANREEDDYSYGSRRDQFREDFSNEYRPGYYSARYERGEDEFYGRNYDRRDERSERSGKKSKRNSK